MPLTDPNIDTLAGDELKESVAIAQGYRKLTEDEIRDVHVNRIDGENIFRCPYGSLVESHCLPNYLDEGTAFRLLMEFEGIRIDMTVDSISILQGFSVDNGNAQWVVMFQDRIVLATGPKTEAASVMLKAYLKLRSRT